jgi:hypothetical protein
MNNKQIFEGFWTFYPHDHWSITDAAVGSYRPDRWIALTNCIFKTSTICWFIALQNNIYLIDFICFFILIGINLKAGMDDAKFKV